MCEEAVLERLLVELCVAGWLWFLKVANQVMGHLQKYIHRHFAEVLNWPVLFESV